MHWSHPTGLIIFKYWLPADGSTSSELITIDKGLQKGYELAADFDSEDPDPDKLQGGLLPHLILSTKHVFIDERDDFHDLIRKSELTSSLVLCSEDQLGSGIAREDRASTKRRPRIRARHAST